MATLLGDQGAGDAAAAERRAGLAALRTCMADAAEALWPPLQTRLQASLKGLKSLKAHVSSCTTGSCQLRITPVGKIAMQAQTPHWMIGLYNGHTSWWNPVMQTQLQRADHDALSHADIAKWAAPEGMLAAEVGAQNGFVAEVVQDKNVRKVC